MQPSDIKDIRPMASVAGNAECETIAQNIAVILSRTGNTFRLLSFDEYGFNRRNDGATDREVETERPHFMRVQEFLAHGSSARLFSPCWKL